MTTRLLDTTDPRPVHFMGIAGAGMNALAELLVRRGVRVTGCDGVSSAVLDDLRTLGIPVTVGHSAEHMEGTRALVVSSAIPKSHPEVARAHQLGIPVIRRAEALGEAVSGGTLVGIAGTHGKTTTTVMTTLALAAAHRSPTGVVGGRVSAWGGNLYAGGEELFVVEADEYDRSFLALDPNIAVVTNMEADHLDIYRDLADIRDTFAQYVRRAQFVVLCADDEGARTLPVPLSAEVVRYGVDSPDARLRAVEVQVTHEGTTFVVEYDGVRLGEVALKVPGTHNVRNALAALASGILLGASVPQMATGLAAFTGVERRFQRIGEVGGVTIVDDYAHHPTEILATLQAARATFPAHRLLVAFQPHLFTRTRDFADAFGAALALADAVYLTAIYPAREQPIDGVTSQLVADAVQRSSGHLVWHGVRPELARTLARDVRPGDVVFTIGAGDITHSAPELVQLLTARQVSSEGVSS